MNSGACPAWIIFLRLRRGELVNQNEEKKMERICNIVARMVKPGAADDSVETAVNTAFLIEKKVQAKIQDAN
jgi:hypothetical protein